MYGSGIGIVWDQPITSVPNSSAATHADDLAKVGRQLWRRLFLEVRTTEELEAWSKDIPDYCSCRSFYESFAENSPPVFDTGGLLVFEWKHALKSAVNKKLGHYDLSNEDAKFYWLSQGTGA